VIPMLFSMGIYYFYLKCGYINIMKQSVVIWFILLSAISLQAQTLYHEDPVFNKYFTHTETITLPEKPRMGLVRYARAAPNGTFYFLTSNKEIYNYNPDSGKLILLDPTEEFPGLNLNPFYINIADNGYVYLHDVFLGVILNEQHEIVEIFDGKPQSVNGPGAPVNNSTIVILIDQKSMRPDDPDYHMELVGFDGQTIRSFGYEEDVFPYETISFGNPIRVHGNGTVALTSPHRPDVRLYDAHTGQLLHKTSYVPSYYRPMDVSITAEDVSTISSPGKKYGEYLELMMGGRYITYSILPLTEMISLIQYVKRPYLDEETLKNFLDVDRVSGIELIDIDGSRMLKSGEELYVGQQRRGSYRPNLIRDNRLFHFARNGKAYRMITSDHKRRLVKPNPAIEVYSYNGPTQ